jgi:hypothetical protein
MEALNWGDVAKRFDLIDTFADPVLSQFSAEEIQRGRFKLAADSLASGAYETNVARVRANFAEWPNAAVVQGAVPDIVPADARRWSTFGLGWPLARLCSWTITPTMDSKAGGRRSTLWPNRLGSAFYAGLPARLDHQTLIKT